MSPAALEAGGDDPLITRSGPLATGVDDVMASPGASRFPTAVQVAAGHSS